MQWGFEERYPSHLYCRNCYRRIYFRGTRYRDYALATFPINAIVAQTTKVDGVAQLPWDAALILIVISIVLTVLAGLIPSRIAAKKDPVESLRSE